MDIGIEGQSRVNFFLDSIIAGFITDFAVDTAKSYTAAENDFLRVQEQGILDKFIRQSRFFFMIKVS